MKQHKPEKLNIQAPVEAEMPEFTLEEIMEEFGPSTAKSVDAEAAIPDKTVAAEIPIESEEHLQTAAPVQAASTEPQSQSPDDSEAYIPPPLQKKPHEEASSKEAPPMEPTAEKNFFVVAKASQDKKAQRAKKTPKLPKPAKIEKAPRENTPKPVIQPLPSTPPPSPQTLLKQYRDSLGNMRLRLYLLGLFTVLSLLLLSYTELSLHFLPFLTVSLSAKLSLGLLIASLLFSFEVLLQGIRDLLCLRISLYTLASAAAVLCVIDSFKVALSGGVSYCAPVCLILFCLFRSLLLHRSAMFVTLRTVCSFDKPMGLFHVPELLRNADGLRRDTGSIEDFMRQIEQPDISKHLFCIYSTVLLPLTLALALLLTSHNSLGFLRNWMLLLLGAIPCWAMLSSSRPLAALAKRLSTFGGALCGWHSARVFGGRHTIILRDADLFPQSHITSNGMKLYGSYAANRVISYALAALETADSPLVPLFETLLQSQYGKHLHASSCRYYNNGGIGAEIASDIVLVGSLSFMRSMGVHMPNGTRVRLAVYISINGELAGIFAIKYKPSASTRIGLRAVLSNPCFSVILATRDFLITPELLAAKYELPTARLIFPAFSERIRLSETNTSNVNEQGALIAKDTFGAFAATVAAGRTLRSATQFISGLSLFVGTLGTLLCTLLLLWNSAATASAFHIATFQLLWAVLSSFISFLLCKF